MKEFSVDVIFKHLFRPLMFTAMVAFILFDYSAREQGTKSDRKLHTEPYEISSLYLSDKDIHTYKAIFDLQDRGDMARANDLIKKLNDRRLLGYVLSQRYLHPKAYKSSFKELKDWMELYSDLPQAKQIYSLALRKRPDDFAGELKSPQKKSVIPRVSEGNVYKAKVYVSPMERSAAQKSEISNLRARIDKKIKAAEPHLALAHFESSEDVISYLDPVERADLIAQIAARFLYNADVRKARMLAVSAAKNSGIQVPDAAWIAGLSLWKEGQYRQASRYFEMVARSPYASGWYSAAGAYWAARAHNKIGNKKAVEKWLMAASDYPRTFYGLLATRALGFGFPFDWQQKEFTSEDAKILAQEPAGARALALAAVERKDWAKEELLRINTHDNLQLQRALLTFAEYKGFPAMAMRMAGVLKNADHGLYPIGTMNIPKNGSVDSALVNAIIRQESRFDHEAVSPRGATGLMQIMPATARALAGGQDVDLSDPHINLKIGQKYIKKLLADKNVRGDLMHLLIAYNAGPGNLSRWRARWPEVKDPLLFIELIPSGETRSYVERVLASYWIYRMRSHQPTPSMDSVIRGQPATYMTMRDIDRDQNIQLASSY